LLLLQFFVARNFSISAFSIFFSPPEFSHSGTLAFSLQPLAFPHRDHGQISFRNIKIRPLQK
jgi:hypothetical protein